MVTPVTPVTQGPVREVDLCRSRHWHLQQGPRCGSKLQSWRRLFLRGSRWRVERLWGIDDVGILLGLRFVDVFDFLWFVGGMFGYSSGRPWCDGFCLISFESLHVFIDWIHEHVKNTRIVYPQAPIKEKTHYIILYIYIYICICLFFL